MPDTSRVFSEKERKGWEGRGAGEKTTAKNNVQLVRVGTVTKVSSTGRNIAHADTHPYISGSRQIIVRWVWSRLQALNAKHYMYIYKCIYIHIHTYSNINTCTILAAQMIT